MTFITRICFNSSNWQRPTGDASEANNTFHSVYGYGHEEWLFRFEWQIGGWQYGFLQGVNKGRESRLESGARLADVLIFTIDDQQRRRYVARIHDLEFLDEMQSADALDYYKKAGWYDRMLSEIDGVEGVRDGLGDADWAGEILNVRFRVEGVEWFPPDSFAGVDDPVRHYNRYQLIGLTDAVSLAPSLNSRKRRGQDFSPSQDDYFRMGSASRECSPEHARMQAALFEELSQEFPGGNICFEKNYVDVTLETETERVLYEIKSDYSPRIVLRLAIGQLLEYAFYSSNNDGLKLRLVAVGRAHLSEADGQYLTHLRETFNLPLEYRQVSVRSLDGA